MNNINIYVTTLLIFLFSISHVQSQQQRLCTDLVDDHVSGTLCTTFVQHGCILELSVNLNHQTLFHQNVTLYQLTTSNNQTFCLSTDYDCNLCFLWEGTAVQAENAAQGCLTLSGSCLSETLYLGCFTDENVQLCAKPSCPNDCSGNGVCQRDGVCNCFESFYGSDCAHSCQHEYHSLPRLEGTSYHSASEGRDFLGYVKGESNLAFAGILFSLQSSNTFADVYISKSCYPSDNFYDLHFQAHSEKQTMQSITADCSDIEGGYWYIRVVCQSSCSFSITVREELILTLGEKDHTSSISSPDQYYEFKTSKPGYTIEMYYFNQRFGSLVVSIMQSICPTDNLFLDQLTEPNQVYTSPGGTTIHKYIFRSKTAPAGKYFIRVHDPSFDWNSHSISSAYAISASNFVCPFNCQFGKCTNYGCSCFSGFTGSTCQYQKHKSSDSSDSSHHHHHDGDDDDHKNNNDDGGLSAAAIGGIVAGSVGFVVFFAVVVLFVLVVVVVTIKRRRKANNTDTIYNLLTVDEPSFM